MKASNGQVVKKWSKWSNVETEVETENCSDNRKWEKKKLSEKKTCPSIRTISSHGFLTGKTKKEASASKIFLIESLRQHLSLFFIGNLRWKVHRLLDDRGWCVFYKRWKPIVVVVSSIIRIGLSDVPSNPEWKEVCYIVVNLWSYQLISVENFS